jgi:Ca2+/Na+ antiporter
MGYYFNELFGNKQFVKSCLLLVTVTVFFVDIRMGYLDGWGVTVVVSLWLAYLLYLIKKAISHQKNRKKVLELLPQFETQRKQELRQQITLNKNFNTHCYECCHFDKQKRSCSLHIYNRSMNVQFHYDDKQTYCLYWNVTEPKELLMAIDLDE